MSSAGWTATWVLLIEIMSAFFKLYEACAKPEEAEKYFQELVFKTMIPRNIRLSEAPSFGKPILLYDATSTGARSYIELASEIMQR